MNVPWSENALLNRTGFSGVGRQSFLFSTKAAALLLALALAVTVNAQTGQAPIVTVDPAIQVSGTSAVITGTVNPSGLPTLWQVLYGTNTAYAYSVFGTLPAQSTPIAITTNLYGLNPRTTYHYQLVATNSAGQANSPDLSFTTGGPNVPTVYLQGYLGSSTTNATISGMINPNGLLTYFYIVWGTNTAYDHIGGSGSLPAENFWFGVTPVIDGLSPGTIYHYQLVASNSDGYAYSSDMRLDTLPPQQPPIVVTGPASAITGTSATLAGTVNALGAISSYSFQWGTTTAYGNSTDYSTRLPGYYGPQDASAYIYGLSPATTYHYRLVATNSAGMGFGADQTFTTLSAVSVDGYLLAYATNNGTITIVSATGSGVALNIPTTITGLPVTVLDTGAFYGAPLTDVSIPENVTTIGSHAFYHCSLTNLALPNSLTYIGPNAFLYCQQLAAITIPDNVTNIGSSAFQFCRGLSNLAIGKSVRSIDSQAFFGCSALTQVTIPDSVTNLADGPLGIGGPEGAFCYCNSLTNVIIGKGLAYLGNGTFTSCGNLRSVYFQGNAPPFGISWYPVYTYPFFSDTTNAIVYYLPGTTGWTSTYAGQPALLWNPRPVTDDGRFGLRQNRFGFNITGTPNIPLVVEASIAFASASWLPLQNCTLTNGLIYFSDPDWAKYGGRFYRIRSP